MKINAEFRINSVTNRREKAGKDEGPLAHDIGLTGNLPIAELQELFPTDTGYKILLENLYADGDAGDLKTFDCLAMTLGVEDVNVDASVKHGKISLEFEAATFGEVSIKPLPGRRAEIKCRLQIKPDKNQIAPLVMMLHENAMITVASRQGELGLAEPATPPAAE